MDSDTQVQDKPNTTSEDTSLEEKQSSEGLDINMMTDKLVDTVIQPTSGGAVIQPTVDDVVLLAGEIKESLGILVGHLMRLPAGELKRMTLENVRKIDRWATRSLEAAYERLKP